MAKWTPPDHNFVSPSGPCTDCGILRCAMCGNPIYHGQIYMEIKVYDEVDADATYVSHIGQCLTRDTIHPLNKPPLRSYEIYDRPIGACPCG